jgi:hypothetical protein
MEKFIRKIIKEELKSALAKIRESFAATPDEEQIIYNFDAGKDFGINRLASAIRGLDQYYMSDYFPNSEVKETWMFETDTPYGSTQMIEIVHELDDNFESLWKLNISEISRDSNIPSLTNSSGYVKGFNNFIDQVNSKMEKDINPDML